MTKTISVVMPCLNEHQTIGVCIEKTQRAFAENHYLGEIIVADNGSTDGSKEIAKASGARVIEVERKGYGSAYLAGLASAQGEYIIMADSDDTYNFLEINKFVEKLDLGYEFVNGNRLGNLWSIKSLPVIHRYFGAISLSLFLNLLFRTGLTDAHCGMRGLTRGAFQKMKLTCPGMEFASEMLIKAKQAGLKVTEVPITYDPRSQGSKLNPLSDGLRHIKAILGFYLQRIN